MLKNSKQNNHYNASFNINTQFNVKSYNIYTFTSKDSFFIVKYVYI